MKSRGVWVLGGLALVIALLVLLRGPSSAGDSPEHASSSDAANGTSALRLYAEALGRSTGTVEGDFTLPAGAGLLFIFSPTHGFSAAEAQQVASWLSAGGVAVYASEQPEPQLDTQFGIHRAPARPAINGPGGVLQSEARAPVFGGVRRVGGGDPVERLVPTPAQVPLLRNRFNEVVALRSVVGQGQLIVLTDPLVLCNRYLGQADNGRLAADLLALAPAGGRVSFDEFHHGAAAAGSPETAWMTTPWGAALTWTVLIIFCGVALRGRTFGPPIPLYSTRDRSTAEYATAVGSLLHRTGARAVALETLLAATRRAIAERVGIGQAAAGAHFDEAVARRAPELGGRLVQAEHGLAHAAASETGVTEMARRLHDLAYPLASNVNTKESR